MGSKASTFRQRDLTQALVGAKRAGLNVLRFEIDKQGKIIIHTGAPSDAPCDNSEADEWDARMKALGIEVPGKQSSEE
jgi:hypothetical protein